MTLSVYAVAPVLSLQAKPLKTTVREREKEVVEGRVHLGSSFNVDGEGEGFASLRIERFDLIPDGRSDTKSGNALMVGTYRGRAWLTGYKNARK